jgi:SAM-dependent methyltransferase
MTCGETFPVIDGVAVMTPWDPGPVKVRDIDHVSHQLDPQLVEHMESLEGPWLHVGAGASDLHAAGCVEVELDIFRNTDVVGDVTRLPFSDREFVGVVAHNIFEHLAAPADAARELRRVLRPGGEISVQTAFLQPLHADPGHFFNATEAGVRTWFADFDITDVSVSPNFNPAYALSWFASDLLYLAAESFPADDLNRLATTTLSELADFWRSPDRRAELLPLFERLPAEAQRRLAAGFHLRARRPF